MLCQGEHCRITRQDSAEAESTIKNASEIRNSLVHGIRVYPKTVLATETSKVINAITNIEQEFRKIYGYGGWTTAKSRRISKLHSDPYV